MAHIRQNVPQCRNISTPTVGIPLPTAQLCYISVVATIGDPLVAALRGLEALLFVLGVNTLLVAEAPALTIGCSRPVVDACELFVPKSGREAVIPVVFVVDTDRSFSAVEEIKSTLPFRSLYSAHQLAFSLAGKRFQRSIILICQSSGLI
jgi:hypothetical protein